MVAQNCTSHRTFLHSLKCVLLRQVTTLHGKSEVFDAVVLTMPVPQILNLTGIPSIIGE